MIALKIHKTNPVFQSIAKPAFLFTILFALVLAWVSYSPVIRFLSIPFFGIWLYFMMKEGSQVFYTSLLSFYFLFILFSSYWITECLQNFIGLPMPASWLLGGLAFSFASLIHALPIFYCKRKNNFSYFPIILTFSEYIRQPFFWAIPWGWHAYQVIDIPILEALLPIGGQLLATYIVSCIALLIAYSIYYRNFFYWFHIACLLLIFHIFSLLSDARAGKVESLPVHILQGNVGTVEKLDPLYAWRSYEQLLQKQNEPGLNILPEGVLYYPAKDQSLLNKLQQASLLKDSLIGVSLLYDDFSPALIGTGLAQGVYHKQNLVPFGEYIPLLRLLPTPTLDWLGVPHATAHTNTTQLSYHGIKLYPFICYEVFFTPSDKSLLRTSSILITSGENTWYGDSIINSQFILAARMRAIESDKPHIVALNRGPSMIIDREGQIIAQLPYDYSGTLSQNISTENRVTLYQIVPDFVIMLILVILHCSIVSGSRHEQITRLFSRRS